MWTNWRNLYFIVLDILYQMPVEFGRFQDEMDHDRPAQDEDDKVHAKYSIWVTTGGSRGGGGVRGVRGVRTPPPPFGGPPNFIKREKTSRVCARKYRILVLNSYPDPLLSEILYPPLVTLSSRHPPHYLQRWAHVRMQ